MPKWVDFLVKPTNYSNYDLSCTKRFSASDGLLYPVNWFVMNPGETFSMNMRSLIRTNPTKAPLMGRYKVRFVTAIANFKNYAVGLEGYRRSFDWRNFKLPTLPWYKMKFDEAPAQGFLRYNLVKETSLMDYLGFERGFAPSEQQYGDRVDSVLGGRDTIHFNALPLLMYYDYYRNYMINPQQRYYPIVHSYSEEVIDPDHGTIQSPTSYIAMQKIEDLDAFYMNVHKFYDGSAIAASSIHTADPNRWSQIFFEQLRLSGDITTGTRFSNFTCYHGGLCSTLFDPDINTNWLSVDNYNRLSEARVNAQTADSKTFIDFGDIVKASSLWDFVTREIYGGGTYADHIYGQFGVSVKGDMNIPQIVHVYDSMIDFEDVTSQSDTANSNSNPDYSGAKVGQQSGVGRGYGQSSRFKIRNIDKNYAIVMTFMWITPMTDYSTGLDSFYGCTDFSDLYSPSFDNYAMQPRLQEQLIARVEGADGTTIVANPADAFSPVAYLGTTGFGYDAKDTLGYQPSWSEYKTNLNRVHGLFANQLSYWSIIRKITGRSRVSGEGYYTYVWETTPGSILPMRDAHGIEVPFSVEDEDNFFCQVRFDVTATRPMSKSMMPHVK